MNTAYLLILPYLVIALVAMDRWRFMRLPQLPRWFIPAVFLLKVSLGMGLTVLYTEHYTDRDKADIYKYFDDSEVIHESLWESPLDYLSMVTGIEAGRPKLASRYYFKMRHWYRSEGGAALLGNRAMIRFNAVLRLMSFGNIYVHTVAICFLSLIGLVALYRTFMLLLFRQTKLLAAAVFLLPGVLFWGSGLLKESLAISATGLLFFAFFEITHFYYRRFRHRATIITLTLLASCIVVLLFLKAYLLMVAMVALAYYAWTVQTRHRHPGRKLAMVWGVVLIGVVVLSLIAPSQAPTQSLAAKQQAFSQLVEAEAAGSAIAIRPLDGSVLDLVLAAPMALVNVALRPAPFELNSMIMIPAALESLLIGACLLLTLLFCRRRQDINFTLLYTLLSVVIPLFLIIGWVTPVLGAIVRYRAPFLPLLFIALLLLLDPEKVRNFFRRFAE